MIAFNQPTTPPVPSKAGTQGQVNKRIHLRPWVPAFAHRS
jgi:hypothetical protein